MSRLDFVAIALKEVGVVEITPNTAPRILDYRESTTLGVSGVPNASWYWCSAFVCWCMREYLDKHSKRIFERMKSARAHDWETWSGGQKLNPKLVLAKAGDVVTFEFDNDSTAEHVGIVTRDQEKLTDHIHTVEGNTAPGSASRDGGKRLDGVYEMTRSPKLCRKYIRWL